MGDVGYVDDDGFLYLTDRKTFMIISGGVNIYPQECEDLLISHPWVADAAVFGVPNVDLGEEVKAVVQLMPGIDEGEATTEGLLAYLREHLSRQKLPRSIDYREALPVFPRASCTSVYCAMSTGETALKDRLRPQPRQPKKGVRDPPQEGNPGRRGPLEGQCKT